MSIATSMNQVEEMYSLSQFLPRTGMVSGTKITNSCRCQLPQAEKLPPEKTLRELLGRIGKSPKLVDQLASKASREERVCVLVHHKLITSDSDLPIGEGIKQTVQHWFEPSERREEMEGARAAWAVIVYGGSFEN